MILGLWRCTYCNTLFAYPPQTIKILERLWVCEVCKTADGVIQPIVQVALSSGEVQTNTAGDIPHDLPAPTREMIYTPEFEAVWQCIKGWVIKESSAGMSCGAMGSHVRAILDALAKVPRGWK